MDSKSFSNINAGTTAAFPLEGGRYVIAAHAATWNSGSAVLKMLCPDGSTYVPPKDIGGSANTLGADGSQTVDVPPGQFVVVVTTTNGVYISISRVPA